MGQLIKNFFGHLKTIIIHKWWVFYYSCKFGIPWRGFWHDMSKFSPIEFWEGVKYYQGDSSPITACKKDKGYSLAWQHHKGRNPHHYEYWIDKIDEGGKPIQMPFKYVMELICDYLAAGRTYNGKTFTFKDEYQWWLKKKSQCNIHPLTKEFIDIVLFTLNTNIKISKSNCYKLYKLLKKIKYEDY